LASGGSARGQVAAVAAALVPVLAVLALVEVALRVAWRRVPPQLGTALYSVYEDKPGDIYFRDRPSRTLWMWPGYATRAYWNGYAWEHRTDEAGFRNPPGLADRSLLLLGDSMIYGHGVEESDTVAHFLRAEHGRGAYNMGRQGDCLFEEYVKARLYLPRFRPRTVVLTVFLNDFEDLETKRTPEQIASPPELALDYEALAARLAAPRSSANALDELHRSKVWRLLEAAAARVRRGGAGAPAASTAAPAVAAAPPVASFLAPMLDDARFAPIARYYEILLGDLAARTRTAGAELVLLHLDVGDHVVAGSIAAQDRVRALLESIAAAHGLRVLGTRALFEGCDDCYLPDDGHLSREGHRRLAAFLDGQLS
jgi:hypothetical protein